jgi:hypothetical protein
MALAVAAVAPAPAAKTFSAGERVLGKRDGQYHPAKVTASGDAGVELAFDDGATATLPAEAVKPFDWKVGTRVECRFQGDKDRPFYAGAITALDGDTLTIGYDDLDGETVPVAMCREPKFWWDEMSDLFTKHASYKLIKAMPKRGSKLVTPGEASGALDYWLQAVDGGVYIKIRTCVVTGKAWSKISSGDELVARTIDVACAIEVPLPPEPQKMGVCLVLYASCRQEHQGYGEYGGCTYVPRALEPNRIDCKKAK